jgi:ATP-dependent DNA helicase PIF1
MKLRCLVGSFSNHTNQTKLMTTPLKRRYDETLFQSKETKQPPLKKMRCEVSDQGDMVLKTIEEGKNIFITGSAGTGKSTLLNRIIQTLPEEGTFVTASTGIAATQINGTTIHSFAGIGLGKESKHELLNKVNKSKAAMRKWVSVKILIIDEISMVDGQLFDALEHIARMTRGIDEPFGGIQVICCGDFLQLPPVPNGKGEGVKFCFESESWKKTIQVCINLTTIYRQRNEDYIKVLEEVRRGVCSRFSRDKLLEKVITTKQLIDCGFDEMTIKPTKLYALNKNVEALNKDELDLLPGEVKLFQAIDRGNRDQLNLLSQNAAPDLLALKVGAQVMLTCNLDVKAKLCNGTRGIVTKFEPSILDEKEMVPVVLFNSGTELAINLYTWKVIVEGKTMASRSQIPLKCAWALSVHKSQGQTLDLAVIKCDDMFEFGQMYVALSRVTSLDGLKLLGFNPNLIKAHPRVIEFYNGLG